MPKTARLRCYLYLTLFLAAIFYIVAFTLS